MKEKIFRSLCLILVSGFIFSINCLDESLRKSIVNLDINEFKKITSQSGLSQEDINETLKIIDVEIDKNQTQLIKSNNKIMLSVFGCLLGSAIIDYNLSQLSNKNMPYLNCRTILNTLFAPLLMFIDTIKNLPLSVKVYKPNNYNSTMRNINGVVLGATIFTSGSLAAVIKFYEYYKLKSKIKKYNEFKKIILDKI